MTFQFSQEDQRDWLAERAREDKEKNAKTKDEAVPMSEKELEDKIRKNITKEGKELKGTKKEKDWVIEPSEEEPMVLRELNETQVAELRESIRKARESEGNNDPALSSSRISLEKEQEGKDIENIRQELRETSPSMRGDFIENNEPKKINLVEKYGGDVIAKVRKMYTAESARLTKMGYKDAILETALARFKKRELEPILLEHNKKLAKQETRPEKHEGEGWTHDLFPKPEPKKKLWDRVKSVFKDSRYGN